MDKKMELLNNEKWLVEMAGIFDRVTGYRYIHLTTTNKEENLTYKSFTVPFDKVVDNKARFNEFTCYGLKRNEVKTVVQEIKENFNIRQAMMQHRILRMSWKCFVRKSKRQVTQSV